MEIKKCPICSKQFKVNYKGRKTCSRKCGGVLGSRNTERVIMSCRICGSDTMVKKCSTNLPVYCSDSCRKKRHKKNCLYCKKEFLTAKSETKTCSTECAANYRNTLCKEETCYCCKKKFVRPTLGFGSNKKRYFCSTRCRNRTSGRENRFRYGKNWNYMRNVRLFIDKQRCVKCGDTNHLEVHHFIPKRLFDTPDEAHYLNNLITLCKTCHKVVEDCDKNKYKNAKTVKDIV